MFTLKKCFILLFCFVIFNLFDYSGAQHLSISIRAGDHSKAHYRSQIHSQRQLNPQYNLSEEVSLDDELTLTNYLSHSFYGSIEVGSSGLFKVLIHLSFPHIMIPSDQASANCCACVLHKNHTPLERTSHTFDHEVVGDGLYSGFYASDSFKVNNITVTNVTFAEILNTTSKRFLNAPWDGFMGLGFVGSEKEKANSIVDVMFKQGKIKGKMFALYLNASDFYPMSGKLIFGTTDFDYYHDPIQYVGIHSNEWKVYGDGVLVGENNYCTNSTSCVFNFETDVDSILLADELAYDVNMKMGARKHYQPSHQGIDYKGWTIDCNTTAVPQLRFRMNKIDFAIPTENLIKKSYLKGYAKCETLVRKSPDTKNYLGLPFFKSFFTVFDMEYNRMGFAKPK